MKLHGFHIIMSIEIFSAVSFDIFSWTYLQWNYNNMYVATKTSVSSKFIPPSLKLDTQSLRIKLIIICTRVVTSNEFIYSFKQLRIQRGKRRIFPILKLEKKNWKKLHFYLIFWTYELQRRESGINNLEHFWVSLLKMVLPICPCIQGIYIYNTTNTQSDQKLMIE